MPGPLKIPPVIIDPELDTTPDQINSTGAVEEIGITNSIFPAGEKSLTIGTEFQKDSIVRRVFELIPERHKSSRKVYNKFISALDTDLSAIYAKARVLLNDVDTSSVSFIHQILSRLSILKNKRKELAKTNEAILDGYTDVYTEEFHDLGKVDLSKSIMDFQKGSISSVRQICSEKIDYEDINVSFEPVATRPVRTTLGPGSTFDLLSSDLSRTSMLVESNTEGPVTGRFIMQLREPFSINGIVVDIMKSRSNMAVELKAGNSASDAETVHTVEKYNGGQLVINNAGVPTKYLLLEIHKENFDTRQVDPLTGVYTYLYDFSVKELQPTLDLFCMESYVTTKPQPLPENVTEYVTELETLETDCTNYASQIILIDSNGNERSLFSPNGKLFREQELVFDNVGFKAIYRKDIVQLDLLFPENTLNKTIIGFRNTKQTNVTINDVPSGWKIVGDRYSTNIQFEETTTINFGPSVLDINGVEKTGEVTFQPGVYNIITARWLDIGDTYDESLDRLAPFNHKYLIELNRNIKTIAAEVIDFVHIFDLEHLSQFKDTKFGSLSSGLMYVNVPDITKDEIQEWRKEEFKIQFRTAIRTEEEFKIRIDMTTDSNKIPSVLDGFTIKFR